MSQQTRPSVTGGADVRVEGLHWRPARRRTPVFDGLDLDIPAGQRVLVAGPSGAGKSTLLRALAGVLLTADHGELSGRIWIGGHDIDNTPGRVGLLLQDPAAGVVAETAGRDVAFGLENRRVPRDEMWPRVHAALRSASFPYDVEHPTRALSGGETQRLMLAGSLVLDSAVMLLDEPTSMLDPAAAGSVREAIRRDAVRRGCTTILVEHHLEPWLDFVDRVVVLGRRGDVVADGPPDELVQHGTSLAAEGVWVPGMPAPELFAVDAELVAPWHTGPDKPIQATDLRVELGSSLVDRKAPPTVALDGVAATLTAGRAVAVTGASGAGKSTLVAVLAGLLRPSSGEVHSDRTLATSKGRSPWRWASRDLAARLSWVPQTPEHGVVAKTVEEEVLASARACRRDVESASSRARGLLEVLGLSQLADASPYHLSGGEQRRLMVAAALVHGPYAVLLDEPTVGQDRRTWAAVLGAVGAARDAGSAVALSTHDERAIEALADDRLRLQRGRMVA